MSKSLFTDTFAISSFGDGIGGWGRFLSKFYLGEWGKEFELGRYRLLHKYYVGLGLLVFEVCMHYSSSFLCIIILVK